MAMIINNNLQIWALKRNHKAYFVGYMGCCVRDLCMFWRFIYISVSHIMIPAFKKFPNHKYCRQRKRASEYDQKIPQAN